MITVQLSSDILEEQFGPTTINILHQDEAIRVIQTVAVETGQMLELSLVRFAPEGAAAFPDVHATVLAGESMGKAFRAAGIEFKRETQFARRHPVPATLQKRFDSTEPATVTSVRILVGPHSIPYAHITETYTPAAHWPKLFGELTAKTNDDLELLAVTISAQNK